MSNSSSVDIIFYGDKETLVVLKKALKKCEDASNRDFSQGCLGLMFTPAESYGEFIDGVRMSDVEGEDVVSTHVRHAPEVEAYDEIAKMCDVQYVFRFCDYRNYPINSDTSLKYFDSQYCMLYSDYNGGEDCYVADIEKLQKILLDYHGYTMEDNDKETLSSTGKLKIKFKNQNERYDDDDDEYNGEYDDEDDEDNTPLLTYKLKIEVGQEQPLGANVLVPSF